MCKKFSRGEGSKGKKFLFGIFASLLLVFFVNSVLAIDIGYVADGNGDSDLKGVIVGLGYSYEIIRDSDISSTDFSNYEVILVWDESLSNYRDIPIGERKSLVGHWRGSYLRNWGIAEYTNKYGSSNHYESGLVASNGHVIVQGLASPIQLYDDKSAEVYTLPTNSGDRAPELGRIVLSGSNSRVIIGAIDSGGELYEGGFANEKIVFFGVTEVEHWTSATEQLFANSLGWLIGNDKDGDGFYLGEDCDDDDASIYPGADEILDNIDQNCVNDAPRIVSFEPTRNNVDMLDSESKGFSVVVSDVDDSGNLIVKWLIDGVESGNGNRFVFDRNEGDYDLKVVVSDGVVEVGHLWNVVVGGEDDFSCSEVDGFICSSNETCSGSFLDVYDSDRCCSVSCSDKELEFSGIVREGNKNSDIKIEIDDPNEDEEFDVGDVIQIQLDIENNAEEDVDFEVDVYLYDGTLEKIVEDVDDSFDIDKDENEIVEIEIEIPEDLNEDNEYYIFVRVVGEGSDLDYYNEEYNEVKIDRKKEDVIIKRVDVSEMMGNLVCGDYFNVDVKVKNLGSDDTDVVIKVENSDLEISEESEKFELEQYDGDDSDSVSFSVKISDSAEAGSYPLKITASFGDENIVAEKDLILWECDKETKSVTGDVIGLGGGLKNSDGNLSSVSNDSSEDLVDSGSGNLGFGGGKTVLVVLGFLIFVGVVGYLVWLVNRG